MPAQAEPKPAQDEPATAQAETTPAQPEQEPTKTEPAQAEPVPAQDESVPAQAEESAWRRLGAEGSLRVGAWTQDRELDSDSATGVIALRGAISPETGDRIALHAAGWAQQDTARGTRADLTEAWLRAKIGPVELTAGRQIVVWGRADRLNPTDVIGSRDYTLLTAEDDEQRRGSMMVQLRHGSGAWTIDAYWLPEFRPIRYPFEKRRAGVALLPDERPEDYGQFALKIDHSGGAIDWSLSLFDGIDRTRDFVGLPAPAGSPRGVFAAVQQRWPRSRMIGGDIAGTLGRIGWRGEIAYTDVRGPRTPYRKQDSVWAVIGADTTLAGGWNVNVQYSIRVVLRFRGTEAIANPVVRAIASQSAGVNNQLDPIQNGVTLRLARKFLNDTLDVELATIGYIERRDAAIRPRVSYAVSDKLRATAAADIFAGPTLGYYGRVRGLSAGFLQLNYAL